MIYPPAETDFSKPKVFMIAAIMAAMAGYVNSAILIEFATPVSQMTGIASRLSEHLIHFKLTALLQAFGILIAFIFGAFISGLMIGHTQYRQDKSYGQALLLTSGLLFGATLFAYLHFSLTIYLTAIACGLQNALVASYRGLLIRTTHMTGIATDLGVYLAHKFKQKAPLKWQAYLLLNLLISFILGGILGILGYQVMPDYALIVPALILGILGWRYLRGMKRNGTETR